MPPLRIQRHKLVPDRLALYEPDGTLVASFPAVPGVDPWKRRQDAIDFAKQINRRFITDRTQEHTA